MLFLALRDGLVSRWGEREPDRERAALARRAINGNCTTMRLDDLFDIQLGLEQNGVFLNAYF